jgi:hypothetical protein
LRVIYLFGLVHILVCTLMIILFIAPDWLKHFH